MAELILKRYMSHRWSEAWERCPQGERDAFLEEIDKALQQAGGTRIVIIQCDSAYALKEWDTFGMEIFPDEDAVQVYAKLLDELDHSRFVQTAVLTGTEADLREWFRFD